MSSSPSNSSESTVDSFATVSDTSSEEFETTTLTTVVKTVKVFEHRPMKVLDNNLMAASTPTFKRKCMDSSFSPVLEGYNSNHFPSESKPTNKVSVRRRSNSVVDKARKSLTADLTCKTTGKVQTSVETQTEPGEDLVELFREQASVATRAKMETAIRLQVESECSKVLADSLADIAEKAEDALRKAKVNSVTLEKCHEIAMRNVLIDPANAIHLHNKLIRDLKLKARISNDFSVALSKIYTEAKETAKSVKKRRKDAAIVRKPWNHLTGRCDPASQQLSSSQSSSSSFKRGCNTIQAPKSISSKRVPVNPNHKFLKAKTRVHFSTPLNQFLEQPVNNESSSTVANEPNIEIEIKSNPVIQAKSKFTQKEGEPKHQVRKFKSLDREQLSLDFFNVSQLHGNERDIFIKEKIDEFHQNVDVFDGKDMNEEIEKVKAEWESFASSRSD